ncbi:kinase-like domain-containing protein [Protomyces lactucae-debilis]|uniref:Cyclin-dependent kinase 8 n=1 Tax=Protomyces lactucae-debilis TaxID=2754530 RepID=A0A1Y2EQ85_PROLT|nr:kinase-like domain-containing protein [Protomyces lactucae-debilis]ORY73692.1 kinase-like domain-containing protein [Protomyces lactucae-debilis]
MERYFARKNKAHVKVLDKYVILGFISSGTYGKVYKAKSSFLDDEREYAIKKFKPDRDGQAVAYTGLSQSAIREMALCRELRHENLVNLHEIILEDKCIYMVFEYAEYDLLQIIHYHVHQPKPQQKIHDAAVRSIMAQLIQGVDFLHKNWVMHRDLKPANIMINKNGQVKCGDLGLARLFFTPLQPFWAGDKVVVTIWYRAPELLLGAKHYGPAIDMWAIGCIFAELLVLRPLFKGDEAKVDNKKQVPFQREQLKKIIDMLGKPTPERWPDVVNMPEYNQLKTFRAQHYANQLPNWYNLIGPMAASQEGLKLLMSLLEYDPTKRLSAEDALKHPYFQEMPKYTSNAFEGTGVIYPNRQIRADDTDMSHVVPVKKVTTTANQASSSVAGKRGHDTVGGTTSGAKRAK